MSDFYIDIEKLTLQEVVEQTSSVPIAQGGLKFMILKLVREIEEIKRSLKDKSDDAN